MMFMYAPTRKVKIPTHFVMARFWINHRRYRNDVDYQRNRRDCCTRPRQCLTLHSEKKMNEQETAGYD